MKKKKLEYFLKGAVYGILLILCFILLMFTIILIPISLLGFILLAILGIAAKFASLPLISDSVVKLLGKTAAKKHKFENLVFGLIIFEAFGLIPFGSFLKMIPFILIPARLRWNLQDG